MLSATTRTVESTGNATPAGRGGAPGRRGAPRRGGGGAPPPRRGWRPGAPRGGGPPPGGGGGRGGGGLFPPRHIALHDARTGEVYKPIQHLADATASFEVHNSPLSELAAVGFEYGYSIAASEALVLLEAQFGDFVNGAQIIVDQFMVSGLSKWRQTSRLTLLLPHGYEGNGPEHSSGRLERFLQLAAQENMRIANCTTAAQFFHLLRREALPESVPLRYAGRPWRASPSEGYPTAHLREQDRIVREALGR